jgi:ribonuclease J
MEKVTLWFHSGKKGLGFEWISNYRGVLVGLCSRRFCEICQEEEWSKMKGFRGGKLEVILTSHYRPVWGEKKFYVGHLAKVLEAEILEKDEGIEFEISKLNTFLITTEKGAILVDPGGYNGEEFISSSLVTDQRIKMTIITHGHLDHWNQLHQLEKENPIFMGPVTSRLISHHASLEGNSKLMRVLEWREEIYPGQPFNLGDLPVRIDTFSVPHSIPETMGMVIKGERKRLVLLSDFKLSGMEYSSKAEIISLLGEVGREGVDILALNIINSHLPGFAPLESLIIGNLINVLAEADGRVIITCFSTNLERMERIVQVARILKRPVEFYGTGMKNAQELLKELYEVEIEKIEGNLDKSVIFVTGCQGEEKSVLWRLARGKNPPLELRSTDTLIFSSRCILGNEVQLREVISELRPKVKRIIVNEGELNQVDLKNADIEEALVHVSGHGNKEDLRLTLDILKPKVVLPWPQISPQIEAFREITKPLGIEILDEKERVIEV